LTGLPILQEGDGLPASLHFGALAPLAVHERVSHLAVAEALSLVFVVVVVVALVAIGVG